MMSTVSSSALHLRSAEPSPLTPIPGPSLLSTKLLPSGASSLIQHQRKQTWLNPHSIHCELCDLGQVVKISQSIDYFTYKWK